MTGPGEYTLTGCDFYHLSVFFLVCEFTGYEPGEYTINVRLIVNNSSRFTEFHSTETTTSTVTVVAAPVEEPSEGPEEPQNTTVTVTTSPNPSGVGEVVVVAVELPEGSGGELPSGEVEIGIPDDGFSCTITVIGDEDTNSSKGGCNWTPSGVGTYAVGASYAGDAQFNPSSDSASHTVEAAPPPTSTTSIDRVISPNLSIQGETATVYISGGGSDGGTPTGSVAVSGAAGSCTAILDANGEGKCSYQMKQAGQHTITAKYGGDGVYEASSGTISYGVIEPTPKPVRSGGSCDTDTDSDCDGVPDVRDACPYEGDIHGKGVNPNGCPIN